MKIKTAFLVLVLAISFAQASDFVHEMTPLDKPYPETGRLQFKKGFIRGKSNTEKTIQAQSPVRSQIGRGTCSIFSATGMAEFQLRNAGLVENPDLSEQWLEYVIQRNQSGGGSSSYNNLPTILRVGMPTEATFPYNGQEWKKVTDSALATKFCGKVPENYLEKCLRAQRDPRLMNQSDQTLMNPNTEFYDPEFKAARDAGRDFVQDYVPSSAHHQNLNSVDQIKNLLNQGEPVLVDLRFYYGAWNHRKADQLGIGINTQHWALGLVGYPEPNSIDYLKSQQEPAGHSVLLVGYDDSVVVETTPKMQDGTTKTFKYYGVYYFKNSWGTGSFGRDFNVNGVGHPGYGAITQRYAHQYGSFYALNFR